MSPMHVFLTVLPHLDIQALLCNKNFRLILKKLWPLI